MPNISETKVDARARYVAPSVSRSHLSRLFSPNQAELSELRELLEGVAKLVDYDPVYLPIFERLENEIIAAQAESPIERARALLARQKAMA